MRQCCMLCRYVEFFTLIKIKIDKDKTKQTINKADMFCSSVGKGGDTCWEDNCKIAETYCLPLILLCYIKSRL